jgi:hypothetical protein
VILLIGEKTNMTRANSEGPADIGLLTWQPRDGRWLTRALHIGLASALGLYNN